MNEKICLNLLKNFYICLDKNKGELNKCIREYSKIIHCKKIIYKIK